MTNRIRITSSCWVELTQRGLIIGDDLHMSGLDSPAGISTPDEARALAEKLLELAWSWQLEGKPNE